MNLPQLQPVSFVPARLRIFDGEATPSPEKPDDLVSISAQMRLSEFFEAWFVPVVLSGQRNSKASTIASYRESVEWWARLSGDPRLCDLDGDELAATRFITELRTACYRRGQFGLERPLSKFTQHKHATQVDAVLYRCGPAVHRRDKCSGLIDRPPCVRLGKPRTAPKDPIELAEARRLFAAAGLMVTPNRLRSPAKFWEALTSVLYYTGLRIGTVLKLRPDWLVEEKGGHWLQIPGEGVVKRDKSLRKFVHEDAVRALQRLPHDAETYFGGFRVDYLRGRHERLQAFAGIKRAVPYGFHAWRRLHGVQIALLGAKAGLRAAQWALDHENVDTTSEHYVNIERDLIELLPRLAVPREGNPGQLNLFQ